MISKKYSNPSSLYLTSFVLLKTIQNFNHVTTKTPVPS
jgi:hypothetical protein